jgi:hypothetical protein
MLLSTLLPLLLTNVLLPIIGRLALTHDTPGHARSSNTLEMLRYSCHLRFRGLRRRRRRRRRKIAASTPGKCTAPPRGLVSWFAWPKPIGNSMASLRRPVSLCCLSLVLFLPAGLLGVCCTYFWPCLLPSTPLLQAALLNFQALDESQRSRNF